ncbi:MAG: phycobilisome rod-core linker polypeptide CpcG [Okeania sp. SIO3H1]|uniref:phycobilisome rod-core linker polypeptide n=1 Tax=Okeania sp. SIO1I7 TaxID=2607772 RepID=UPI0013CCC92F|nr:phycobilisome rod-core linker polypeptide [Okeania sp. SIO1I7]NEN90556.1 phycobilisome rod-core linker polypeptide CpcG [Okeania sp. SIO3H1]NET27572.1 phycobilisome rod-core linker polypeptide CpcG [Okeania sp. SIO1I7]
MTIPLMYYPLSSQNHRVQKFDVPGDEYPIQYTLENLPTATEMDEIIWAAYRQIFNEQQIIAAHRQVALESQLRNGQITIKDFIQGLLLSESFRRLIYDSNSNYRCVELCIQRVLGRPVYNNKEKLAWSIVLATKGLQGFVNDLLNSEEYDKYFGYNFVPYQRCRILPQRTQGELPFARMARYDSYYLEQLYQTGQLRKFDPGMLDSSAYVYRKALSFVGILSVAVLLITLTLVLSPK